MTSTEEDAPIGFGSMRRKEDARFIRGKGSFITRLSESTHGRDLALVRATVELAHALGLRVVAEGVEDDHCLELLTGLRCDLVQGYVFSKPKRAAELDWAPHRVPGLAVRRAAA